MRSSKWLKLQRASWQNSSNVGLSVCQDIVIAFVFVSLANPRHDPGFCGFFVLLGGASFVGAVVKVLVVLQVVVLGLYESFFVRKTE